MIPIILSGGSGSRLWPLSRRSSPKQFLALHTPNTLFQETVLRLKNLKLSKPIVVCNEGHRFTVANNIQDIGCKAQQIILEPIGRNTAPAIAVAALSALEKDADSILLVLPADHQIENEEALAQAYKTARELAEKDYLVTFGVKPTEAHTGYGYIKLGQELNPGANEITSFIEKPIKEKAEEFFNDGGYLWNSGMFCFKAARYISELEQYQPELLKYAKEAVNSSKEDFDFTRLDQAVFEKCENISIDYAVMEHTQKGCVVSIDAQWSDIGSWDAVWAVSNKDVHNNVQKGDVIEEDTKDSFLYSPDKLLVTLGVENLVIINLPDVVLVADKSKVQNIKTIVERLKSEKRSEVIHHTSVDRPWGCYDLLYKDSSTEVKHITIKPKGKIALQQHKHRSEHWVVVKGSAKVVKDDETLFLEENDSIEIPMNVNHSLENTGDENLEIFEIRTGSYIGEDDVVRVGG